MAEFVKLRSQCSCITVEKKEKCGKPGWRDRSLTTQGKAFALCSVDRSGYRGHLLYNGKLGWRKDSASRGAARRLL